MNDKVEVEVLGTNEADLLSYYASGELNQSVLSVGKIVAGRCTSTTTTCTGTCWSSS